MKAMGVRLFTRVSPCLTQGLVQLYKSEDRCRKDEGKEGRKEEGKEGGRKEQL